METAKTTQKAVFSVYGVPPDLAKDINKVAQRRAPLHATVSYAGIQPDLQDDNFRDTPKYFEWFTATEDLPQTKTVDFIIGDVTPGDHAAVVMLRLAFADQHNESIFDIAYKKDFDILGSQMTAATRDAHNGIHITVKNIECDGDTAAAMDLAKVCAAEMSVSLAHLKGTRFTGTYALMRGREKVY